MAVRCWRFGQEAVVDHGRKMTKSIQSKEMRRPGKEAVRVEVGWADLMPDADG